MTPKKLQDQPLFFLRRAYKKVSIMEFILRWNIGAYLLFKYIMKPLAFDSWNRINGGFRFSFLILGGGRMSRKELKSAWISYKEKRAVLKQLLDYVENDKPVVWVEWSVSRIILQGFDVAALCPEGFVKTSPAIYKDFSHIFLDRADSEGLISEGCSSQKGAAGAMLLNQIPKPAVIIATTLPCDSGVSTYQTMQYHTGAPTFVLDAPYDRSDKSVEFYGDQFYDLIDFLEHHLNQAFDWDKFTRAVENYNVFSRYLSEISEMGKAIPCPYHMNPLTDAWELRSQYAGSERATEVAKVLYDTVKDRMEKGRGIVKDEKIRILWWDVPVAFTSVYPWLEEKYGAVTVANFLTVFPEEIIDTTDRRRMLQGAGLIDLNNGMSRQAHGTVDFILDELYEAVENYSPDCIMFVRHSGCRHGWAVSRIIRDTCKKIGLPSLFMSVDIFDSRLCSEDEIKDQIDVFFKSHGLV